MIPTPEQHTAIELARTGLSVKIEAFAGAGKTSTLAAIAEALKPKKGIYIAFNKSISVEAQSKMPANVMACTVHSLAFRDIGWIYKNRLRLGAISGKEIANTLNLSERNGQSATQIGSIIVETLKIFCQSHDCEIQKRHLPEEKISSLINMMSQFEASRLNIDLINGDKLKISEHREKVNMWRKFLELEILDGATVIWEQFQSLESKLPVTHDMYLKVWALKKPKLPFDFILFDEAQDANPVLLHLLQEQQSQLIVVGDRYQQIYSWRGSVNAMSTFKTIHSCCLSQSFRFGQSIANVANSILKNYLGAAVEIRGNNNIKSLVGACEPNAIIFRTNGSMLGTLMGLIKNNEQVYIEGGVKELTSQIRAAICLKKGERTESSMFDIYKNWQEVEDAAKDNDELAQFISLFERFDALSLLDALEKVSSVKDSKNITLTTVHKSKGQQWDYVRLADDFRYPSPGMAFSNFVWSEEEANLLYVAVTRARKIIDISRCQAVLHAMITA